MENLTDGLGRTLTALRTKSGLKQKDLAARTTALGHRMTLSTVSKIENGDRSMSVADVIAFSRVLRVPPVLLLVPAWGQANVEILGNEVDSWRAVQWLSGRRPLLDDDDPFAPTAAVVTLNLQHDDLVSRYTEALEEKWYLTEAKPFLDLKTAMEGESTREPIELQRRIRILLRDLREIRARMRQLDFPLPDLAEELQHVDDLRFRYRTDTELATAFLVDEQTGRPVSFREEPS